MSAPWLSQVLAFLRLVKGAAGRAGCHEPTWAAGATWAARAHQHQRLSQLPFSQAPASSESMRVCRIGVSLQPHARCINMDARFCVGLLPCASSIAVLANVNMDGRDVSLDTHRRHGGPVMIRQITTPHVGSLLRHPVGSAAHCQCRLTAMGNKWGHAQANGLRVCCCASAGTRKPRSGPARISRDSSPSLVIEWGKQEICGRTFGCSCSGVTFRLVATLKVHLR